jgi:ribosome-associated protein
LTHAKLQLTEDPPQRTDPLPADGSAVLDPEVMLAAAVELAADRKALDIVTLDLRGMIGYADYFVIATGRSDRQTRAIHDAIHLGLKQRYGLLPRRAEGLTQGNWVLMDYLDIVVHLFTPETREFYRLEQLWGDAPQTTAATSA